MSFCNKLYWLDMEWSETCNPQNTKWIAPVKVAISIIEFVSDTEMLSEIFFSLLRSCNQVTKITREFIPNTRTRKSMN